MAEFREEVRGPTPFIGVMVEIQFPDIEEEGDGFLLAWNGSMPITTSDARVWRPLHELASVAEIETGSALDAPGMSLDVVIPGSSTEITEDAFIVLLREFLADPRLFGCLVRIYGQGMTRSATAVEISGPLAAIYVGRVTYPQVDWTDVKTAIARLYVEDPLAFAREAPNGRYTGADQRARFPSDTFCDFVATLAVHKTHFPPQKRPG